MTLIELESHLSSTTFPTTVKLNHAETITDTAKFIKTSMTRIKLWKRDLNDCPDYARVMILINGIKDKD